MKKDNREIQVDEVQQAIQTLPNTDIIKRAWLYASKAHRGQFRKHSNLPYIIHPFRVAEITAEYTDDENMIAAALLHDVVEESDLTESDIDAEFGCDIATMVMWLTPVAKPSDGNRANRTQINRNHLAMAPPRPQLIKAADINANIENFPVSDPFGLKYSQEKLLDLDVLVDAPPDLVMRAKELCQCLYAAYQADQSTKTPGPAHY